MNSSLTKNLPIGVFDSGIGGLNVLNRLAKKFKSENFIYLGDNKNAPYGNKTLNEIKELTVSSIDKLLSYNVKAVVIACNTVSTNLYGYLKAKYDIPIIPTVPPVTVAKTAVLACTSNTAKSDFVKSFYKDRVISFSTLAKDIEDNIFSLENLNLIKIFAPLPKNVTTLILGCTHYSFLQSLIEKNLKIKCLDGYDLVANALEKSVNENLPSNISCQKIDFVGNSGAFNQQVFLNFYDKNL